jgi:putative oxidoreductase
MASLGELLNVHDTMDVLRVLCGLFFIPHVVGKFFVPAALGFFQAAGFRPPKFWMYLAGAVEIALTIALVFGISTTYAASIAAIHLAVAAVALYRLSGKWLWNIGGNEYAVFWALCCALAAIHG